ncbi:MAG: transporter substrate-binding domain-containing protein [Chitinivibrionales bacterium]|nr:transporter substrate-binding domain-containing protein [Chitinivibrionales bacterium]
MKLRQSVIGFMVACCVISSQAQQLTEKDLVYITEEFPPQNYMDDDKLQGISVEILESIWKSMGSNLNRSVIKLMPWSKAYQEALNTKNSVIFGMKFTKEREQLFKWVGPYYVRHVRLFAKKEEMLTILSLDDVKKRTVGCIQNDISQQILKALNFDMNRVDLSPDLATLIMKLNTHTIEFAAALEDDAVTEIGVQGLDERDFDYSFTLEALQAFYAFHKDTPDYLVLKFQRAFEKVKNVGYVERIVDKYTKDFAY